MNSQNTGAMRLSVEYIAELRVRPREGGPPVTRGPVTVRHEVPAQRLAA